MVLNSITLDQTSLTLGVGGTATLTATLNPTDYNGTVTFASTNSNVVKVDSTGNLTAKAVGSCTITASAGGKTASCVVTVTNSVTAISLDQAEVELPAGEITLLTATTTPAGLSYSALSWSSSNPSVATVNEYGVVIGVSAGDAIIYCRAANNYSIVASCLVTVKNSINYQLDGGTNSAENPEFCEAGETVTLQDPEKKGYEFAGWYADADFTTPVTEITADSTGVATVYAKWSKISVSKPSIKKLYTKVSGKLYVYLTGTVEGADGYQYVYATKSDFSDKKTSSVAGTTRGLNVSLNTKYYVKVRAYRIDSSGARVYSGYSSVFSATTASVKADNLTGIKVSSSSGKLTIAVAAPVASSYGYQYVYSTSSSFSKTTYVTTRSRSCTVSSLPKGTYYVRARTTYLDPVTGGYTYGLYTTTTKITIK
jgi:endo-1,4-beta-xylanase